MILIMAIIKKDGGAAGWWKGHMGDGWETNIHQNDRSLIIAIATAILHCIAKFLFYITIWVGGSKATGRKCSLTACEHIARELW